MKLHKEFFHCVIPSMLAFALSGVYAIADGFFVGNALGDSALAAVNLAYPLTAFLQAVGTGIGMGGATPYAISAGTENHKRCRQYFGMSLFMLIISGLLLSILLLFSAPVEMCIRDRGLRRSHRHIPDSSHTPAAAPPRLFRQRIPRSPSR